MPRVRRPFLAAAVAAVAVTGTLPLAPAQGAGPAAPCTGDPQAVLRLDLTVDGTPTYGTYTLPAGRPRGLVVFGHGYSYNVDAWRDHMRRASAQDGLVAVTMNYRGLTDLPRDETGFERSRGFPVKKGGEDLVAAAQHLDHVCGGFDRRILLGVSMGGNAAGLGAAIGGKTRSGQRIFDYWIGVEGVYNFAEEYLGARATGATNAIEDFEAEAGGPIETHGAAYAERSLVNRTADIAKADLSGVALIHGAADGLVPYDQARQMLAKLRGDGVKTDLYTATRKAPGDQENDTRLPGASADQPGHASEWAKHIVIDTGMQVMSALARGDSPPPCDRDFTVDGSASPTTSPDPAQPASGCPATPSFAGLDAGGGEGGSGPVVCGVKTGPRVSLRVRRAARRGLSVRGTAGGFGCAASPLRRVRIAVARVGSGPRGCRFVTRASTGRLSRARSCTRKPVYLRPRGRRSFALALRRLRPGRYRVTVVATDAAGRTGRATRRVRLRR